MSYPAPVTLTRDAGVRTPLARVPRVPAPRSLVPRSSLKGPWRWAPSPLLLWYPGILGLSRDPSHLDPGVQPPLPRYSPRLWAPVPISADLPVPPPPPPSRTLLPKLIPSGAGREWLERRRATIRPWGTFVDQQRFSRPRNLGELCQRLVRNVEYYQSNYVFVFLGLILYCV